MRYVTISLFAMLLGASCSSHTDHVTSSGYTYELLYDAPGATAQPGDYVFVWTNILVSGDSSVYNSRLNDPEPTPVDIPTEAEAIRTNKTAVQDVLAFASVGDSIRLVYPVDSFETRPPSLLNEEYVIYDMQVVDIKSTEEYNAWLNEKQQAAAAMSQQLQETSNAIAALLSDQREQYMSGALNSSIQRTDSGLGYIIDEAGVSGSQPAEGELIKAHYYGIFAETGEMFDNSYRRGRTYDFNVGRGAVIRGWDEGFALLNKGASATLFIPPDLAYGPDGFQSIPGNAELIFHVRRTE